MEKIEKDRSVSSERDKKGNKGKNALPMENFLYDRIMENLKMS